MWFSGALLTFVAVSASAWALPPESQIAFPEGVFSYYASGSLTARNEAIERAIVTVHGSERNADTYYNSIEQIGVMSGRPGLFAIPSTACRYDEYKYGLRDLNEYQSRHPTQENVARYVERDVTYLVGEKDINAGDIDQTCAARFQGNTRFERGNLYHAFMQTVFPGHRHSLVPVPNVGHTQYGMYMSETGRAVLLGDGSN